MWLMRNCGKCGNVEVRYENDNVNIKNTVDNVANSTFTNYH
jgi:hypothetical protein